MPERHGHNSRRRHSSLERLISNRLHAHGGARHSFAGLGRREGRGREGMVGISPHFPSAETEKRGVIRGSLLGWMACEVMKACPACHGPHSTRDPGKERSILPTPARTVQRGWRWWVAGPLAGTAVLPVSLVNRT